MFNNETTLDFICSICGDKFKNKNQYHGHLQIHSGEINWNCKQCNNKNISFTSQSKLITHEKLYHNLVRPFKCTKCELLFERSSQLNYHIRNYHLGEKSQVCHICDKRFFRKTDLKTHLNSIHLGKNQLMCEICGRKFNHISNLIRHSRSHAGIKPYPCCICGKRFTQLSSLTRHKKTHDNSSTSSANNDEFNGEKQKIARRKHYCKTCGESFHLIFLLRQHEQQHAKNINNFSCKNCNQVFKLQQEFQEHSCRIKPVEKIGELKYLLNEEERKKLDDIELDEVGPILHDFGQKLNVVGIDLNRDESINISDILGPYNCDEIELTNTSVEANEDVDGDDSRSKCLHIEGNQLFIEVCKADYLKTLELNNLEYEENNSEYFPETNENIGETIQENIEPILRRVHADGEQQFYELEINSLELDQIQEDNNFNNSQNSSFLTTSVTNENKWIEQSVDLDFDDSIRRNFIDDLQVDLLNHQSNSECLDNYVDPPGYEELEQQPTVRLVQNEGAQFFELVRDSVDYHHQEIKHSNDFLTGKLSENTIETAQTIDNNKKKLKKNKISIFRDKKFECIVCNKRFTTMSNLKQHNGTHFSDQQKFYCKECNMSFAWKSTLNKHITSNHRPDGPQKFVCEICPKVYSTLSQVNEHVKRDHLKERNHICPECGKTFFKKFDLKSHIRTHTNERPYVCESCGKAFHHQSHIIRHQRIHSGERPYCCNVCDKSFTHLGSLKVHKQRHQNVEKLHILDYQIDEDDPIILATI